MKHNKINKNLSIVKATSKYLIVAFIYAIVILITICILFSDEIKRINGIVDLISVKSTNKIQKDVKINIETNRLESYPEYGTRYATLIIPKTNVKLPVYYGIEMDILSLGIGHTPGYFFPGEGGTILYAGHNTVNMLHSLPELSNGDEIIIEATYNKYTYKVYDNKILTVDNFFDNISPNLDKEILMIYTCYPVDTLTTTPYRYVVYAIKE